MMDQNRIDALGASIALAAAQQKQQPVAADLTADLLAAANYIDVLGGNSQKYRITLAALGSAPATPVPAPATRAFSGVVEICPDCDIADCVHIRARRATPVQPVPASEPVAWQCRKRVLGGTATWSGWETCTKADHDAIQAKSVHWGMEHESRALCLAAPTAPASAPATPAAIEALKVTDSERELNRRLREALQALRYLLSAHAGKVPLGLALDRAEAAVLSAIRPKESAPATQDKGEGA